VEDNIESSVDNINRANIELEKASDYQKRNRKCICTFVLILIVTILVIIIILFSVLKK
jgi:t-SNARE complex subunit (syntaxin)